MGQRRVRVSRRGVSADRAPELVAPGPTRVTPRPVRGGARHLPGSRLRHLEHDRDRRRQGRHRHRSAHLDGVRGRGIGAVSQEPGRPAGDRADLHPFARRPLRRCSRRADRRGPDRGTRGFPRTRGRRERVRGHGDEPARRVHVRPIARQGARRTDRCRPGHDDVGGEHLARPADARHHAHGPRRGARRCAHPVPDDTGNGGAIGDELLLPRLPGAVHGRERDAQPPQPVDAARGAGTRSAGVVARISMRRSISSPPTPTSRLRPIIGPRGDTRAHRHLLARSSETSMAISTTKRCGSSTRATRASRPPR